MKTEEDEEDEDIELSCTDDDDDDPAETCFKRAKSIRASRAARPPSPSERAKTEAWRLANKTAEALEARGLVRVGRVSLPSWHLQSSSRICIRGGGGISCGSASTSTKSKRFKKEAGESSSQTYETPAASASTSHVLALHAKGVSIGQSEPAYLSYYQQLPPRVVSLAAGSMRSGSVRASIVGSNKKDKAGGSQQTTRVNQLDLLAAWSAGATSVAITIGMARRHLRNAHSIDAKNPACTFAINGLDILGGSELAHSNKPFFMTSTARLLVHALPSRMRTFSFLDTMASVARKEIDDSLLSTDVRQTSTALKSICALALSEQLGLTVWASWILLCFMSSDSRLRQRMEALHITDMDLAVANVYQAWGRAEITRRARLKTQRLQSIINKASVMHSKWDKMQSGLWQLEPDKDLTWELVQQMGQEAERARQELKNERLWTISAKRKRGDLASQAATGCQTSAAGGFCEYWAAAFHSEFAEVLKAVITRNKEAAEQATLQNLRGQLDADVVARNNILVNVATRNAVSSAQAVAGFVVVGEEEVPQSMLWVSRGSDARMRTSVGISRSSEDLNNTSIHACKLAPRNVQPSAAVPHTVLTWSIGVRNTTPVDSDSSIIPSVVETQAHLTALRRLHAIAEQEMHEDADDGDQEVSREVSIKQEAQGLQCVLPYLNPTNFLPLRAEKIRTAVANRAAGLAKGGSVPCTLSGVARSMITLRARIVQPQSAEGIGEAIGDALARESDSRNATPMPPMHDTLSCRALHRSTIDATRDPKPTPANNLGLSLEVNECVRSMKRGKTNGNSPCRMFCGVANAWEMSEKAINEHDRPVMVLPIVDVDIDMFPEPTTFDVLPSRPDAHLRPAVITFTVGGDSPIRIPECLEIFETKVARLMKTKAPSSEVLDAIMESMGILFCSAIRSSELNDVSNSLMAGGVNTAIASAKRIPYGDKNLFNVLTPYQCYRVGVVGPPLELATTAWAQTARVGFDMGTSGASGIKASAYVADQRHHGKLLSDAEQVDELCVESGPVHYMPIDDHRYAAIPVEVRGVPHMGLPNVHDCYVHHDNGLETIRKEAGITADTADNIQCLSFGPYAERLPPHVLEAADPTIGKRFRNPFDSMNSAGLAFQVDGTSPDVSIMRAPLIQRLSTTSPRDNLFASAHPYVQVFFNAASTLALLASTAYRMTHPRHDPRTPDASPANKARFLFDLLHTFHHGGTIAKGANFLWAAHACVLLNVMYPAETAVAIDTIHAAYSMAAPICYDVMKNQAAAGQPVTGAPLCGMGLSDSDLKSAMLFWKAFSRDRNVCKNAWDAVAPLLERILERDGTFDNTLADIDAMANDLETALRAVWLVHSPDGLAAPVAPSALAGVANTTRILARHIEPVFVGRQSTDGSREDARGSVVGLMPCAYHQVLTCMLGIHIPGVKIKYCRNEGQLCYRPSSAADVLTRKGKQRSCKSISLFGTEGDEQCAGTRDEKLILCRLQRLAFKTNLSIMRPIFFAISKPKANHVRKRGDREGVLFRQERRFQYNQQNKTTNLEKVVDDAFAEAIDSRFEKQDACC